MPNDNLDRNVSDEVLQNALNDIIKVAPNSPIPSGMAIDFFTPDNTDYQNVLAASFTSTQTKAGKPVPVTLVDPKHEDTKPNKPSTPEDTKPNKPSTPEVEQPKANTPTTEEVVQPRATEQPSDNTATQKNNDDDFYAIPVKAQTTDKKAKVNHQKAVYKANNSQKMPKATSVVYTANNSEALPKTGAKQSALIVLIGLGMVVLSGFLYKKEF